MLLDFTAHKAKKEKKSRQFQIARDMALLNSVNVDEVLTKEEEQMVQQDMFIFNSSNSNEEMDEKTKKAAEHDLAILEEMLKED